MSALIRPSLLPKTRGGAIRAATAASLAQYGRSPAYRRIPSLRHSIATSQSTPTNRLNLTSSLHTRPAQFTNDFLLKSLSHSIRDFHQRANLAQQHKPADDVRDPPRADEAASGGSSDAGKKAADEAGSSSDSASGKADETGKEGEENAKDGKKKDDKPPPPPHGNKSPLQVFMDTLKSEFKASKEWNEGTKELASGYNEFTQNPNLKRAKTAYTASTEAVTSATGKVLKTTGKAIGQSAAWTWDTLPVRGVRATVGATASGLEKVTQPLRQTEAYKSMSEVIDDGSSSRYGGWTEKEQRRRRREAREMQEAAQSGRPMRRAEPIEEDPNAGTNVTVHKDAAWKESWNNFRSQSKVFQSLNSMKETYAESENPLISTARSITDRVAGFFAENETAMVIKKFREMDPSFQLEPFLQDMREYILPEVLDAYVKGDIEVLRMWLSAAQYQVYDALMKQYTTAGLKSDGRILDIRNVDVLSARLLEPGEIPVFIITCRTQEVHVYRNTKSGELAAGMEDRVQQVTYAIGVTRLPEDVSNPETRGWRLIELQKSARDYM